MEKKRIADEISAKRRQECDYKFLDGPVRKRSEREALRGHACKACKEYYYEGLGLDTENEIRDRMDSSSRHRSMYARPPTPEHFWEIDFPSTEECIERGYLKPAEDFPSFQEEMETKRKERRERRRRMKTGGSSGKKVFITADLP